MKQENISTENRLLAALAHGSVVTQGLGILVGCSFISPSGINHATLHFRGSKPLFFN